MVTVPEELRPIFLKNQKIIYGLLLRTAADEIRRLCLKPKFLGAEPAMLAVLHTWSGQLGHHPHIHFLISAGGVTPDGKSWRGVKNKYLIPASLLSKAVAIEFCRRLEKKHPQLFSQCDHAVWHKPWNSFVKAYGEKQDAVMKFLSRYVLRIAITNARLVSMTETLSRLADEALAPMTGDGDISETHADAPRCPHCHSASTVLIGEVSRQGSR